MSCASTFNERRHLDLSFNQLETLGSVPPLPSLRELSLEGNALHSLSRAPPLRSLTSLSLASNGLTSLLGRTSISGHASNSAHDQHLDVVRQGRLTVSVC